MITITVNKRSPLFHLMLPLLCALPLASCRKQSEVTQAPQPSGSVLNRMLFTAAGTYDAGADQKSRQGGALRQVVWTKNPPLPAQKVTVLYDGNQRAQAWKMTLDSSTLSTQSLLTGSRVVNTERGRVTVLAVPELKGAALWQEGEQLNLATRGFLTQYDAALLQHLTQE